MKLFAKFGAIFVTSQSVVLSLCKIKRLNSNSFVLRLRYLQILFPPGSPYSSSLYCAVFHYWDLWFLRRASKSRVTALCSAFVGAASASQITKKSIIIQKQDKVNNADSAFIFLIIQSQNQWSGQRRWPCLVWSLLER